MRAPSLALALLSLAACSPRVPAGDGHFQCGARGECPAVAPFCHRDNRCHRGPEQDGAVPDGGGTPLDGGAVARCGGAAGMCTGATRCIRDVDADEGYCAPMASTPEACGDGVLASDGYCRLSCTAESDCIGTDCTFGRWEGDTVSGACVETTLARPPGYADACSADASCPRPLQCVAGRCGRSCSRSGDTLPCGPGEMCGPHPTAGFTCIIGCGDGEPCPPGTTCRMPGAGPPACLPDT